MIVHINFGDFFEVAMKRDKCLERVLFRITRMEAEVLEPSNAKVYFIHRPIATLDVLREKEAEQSHLSMMEAFVWVQFIR